MLAYRSAARRVDVREALSDLEGRMAAGDATQAPSLDELRSLLIDVGELETGLLDADCDVADDISSLSAALDDVVRPIAESFVRAWCGRPIEKTRVAAWREQLRALRSRALPDAVQVSTPEGFAYYGLFPETYIDAAEDLIEARAPRSVIVIGIRSIGTTLAGVVAAALVERGISVERLTVRPRGHPFDREVRLSARLTRRIRAWAARPETLFAIVDEGPGLSGSSFASVAEQLAAFYVPDARVVFFPSWNADATGFVSEGARRIWPRHAKFVGDFNRAWVRSGRLERGFEARVVRDLSAGAWRALFYPSLDSSPAIQPQHERRKFLLHRRSGEQLLIKFEGLDRGARERRARAERVATARFGVPVEGWRHGFLIAPWVEGSPLGTGDVTPELLRRVGHYLAWISKVERSGRLAHPAPLLEMLRVNTNEGLGMGCGDAAVRQVAAWSQAVACAPAVRVDGRMLPHEWLRTSDGYLKADAASHFDDHFYPGETDVAWDLAAAVIELALNPMADRMLVREYQAASGDRDIECRLRFMRPAYAAFRLGYTTLASRALGTSGDAGRMRAAAERYGAVLRRELSSDRVDDQSCATGT